jgi:hypothetical protein
MVPFERLQKLSTPLKVQYFTPISGLTRHGLKCTTTFLLIVLKGSKASKERSFGHAWQSLLSGRLSPQTKKKGVKNKEKSTGAKAPANFLS